MSAYDLIVIGSGAGGGTLVRHLASLGQARSCCSSAATGSRASRRTGSRRTCSSRTATSRRTPGTTPTASPSSPRSTTSWAAPRSSTAPRSIASAPRTSASFDTTTASRPPGRSPTTSWSRTTRRPSSSTRCTARAERTPQSPGQRALSLPGGLATSRGFSSSRTTSPPPATTPSTRPAGSCSTRATCLSARCVRCPDCDGFPCLVHAKSDAEVLAVRPALEHPNVTLLTECEGRQAATRTRRAPPSPRWWSSVTERPRRSPATSWSSRAARPTRPSCCSAVGERQASRTGSQTAPTRSVAISCSTTARRCSRCRGRRTRPSSRRPSGSTTSTSAATTSTTRSGTSRWSASRRPPMFRGEKPRRDEARAAVDAGADRAARGRLLALDRGPARGPTTASPSTATASSR